ncbi:MAG: RidA family protein [Pirellulaceae bacterium]|nr:RidA family protein [Pirellulaceae bacterium]
MHYASGVFRHSNLHTMRTYFLLSVLLTLTLSGAVSGADKKVITPVGARPPVGPYSPGILTADYLYVSGQGAARLDGSFPASTGEQVTQSLTNIKAIVEGAGLTMEHVVYTQVYMKDATAYDEMNKAWNKFFPRNPPARATLGVHRMPTETPVEITVVAVRDLSRKKIIVPPGYPANAPVSPGVMVGDRLYLSGFLGRDLASGRIPEDPAAQVELSLDRMGATLKAAGMDFRHLVFVNPYLTDAMPMDVMNRVYAKHFEFGNTPARATIKVASLPNGANVEFTGVAIRDLSKRRAFRPKNMPPSATASPCVLAEDTLYCSAKAGFIPGPNGGISASTVETQVRQTMRNLLDGLEEAGMTFADVVATNVYLDDLNEFVRMNKVYAQYFAGNPPTRTTVQQVPSVERKANEKDLWPALEQISVIAVK